MLMVDSALAIGFRAGASCPRLSPPPSLTTPPPPSRPPHCFSSDCATGCRPPWNLSSPDCASGSHVPGGRRRSYWHGGQRLLGGGTSDLLHGLRNRLYRNIDGCSLASKNNLPPTRACAVPEHPGSVPDPLKSRWDHRYHPSEEIGEPAPREDDKDVRLTNAETARTIIEVNSKATLMFSGLIDDEVHENVIWPDLPYLTDEHGDIYFEVKDDEDILQTLIADDKLVQVIIGLDNIEMLTEMEVPGPSNFDFGIEDITNEDSDIEDDYEEDVVAILEDEDDDMISSETLSDWSNLETLNSSHPMYFARKIAEVVSNIHFDWMEQPSSFIVVQGLLRPAFIEEHTFVRKHPLGGNTSNGEMHHPGEVVEDNIEELDKDNRLYSGTAFYKLEMINVQLVSAYGNQDVVNVQDFLKARPDVIAHSSANIISHLKAGGETTTQALKSLCWRHKGIRVEEAALAGVDSLGFDLRVCSGTQVQTLRFAFNTRATSELSAEKQLRDLLFPRFQHKQQKWQQAHHQKE